MNAIRSTVVATALAASTVFGSGAALAQPSAPMMQDTDSTCGTVMQFMHGNPEVMRFHHELLQQHPDLMRMHMQAMGMICSPDQMKQMRQMMMQHG
ncbi:hypothetical protein HT102_00450 [Hoyosella sp. G463]|uniref:Hemophore-related protein n=1 Tax=Lolliginicoccus lacisalsi TaxID=2742202 RepID=A0A927JAQ6_9ACTN|nr:hypothetical protein [Lolliginicoccus lacisalsi]MBD8504957.1 hypothetical protein [Lolliginicoccus lacisalsi]